MNSKPKPSAVVFATHVARLARFYREVAVGPRTGQKLFTLQTVPARAEQAEQPGDHRGAVNAGGFSLHAGVGIQPHRCEKLERLCRYVSRPPIAVERLALTSMGQVRFQLKSAYRDGTTHIVLDPLLHGWSTQGTLSF
jgi:hypothetical protein